MKRQMVDAFAGLLLAVGLCAGCSREQPVQRIFTWADYIAPELIAAFEKAQDCQVVVDTFGTNEAMFVGHNPPLVAMGGVSCRPKTLKLADGAGQADDITLLALKLKPTADSEAKRKGGLHA